MDNNLVPEQKKDMTPGFGIAGQVMCPFSFMGPRPCSKSGCEWWVELTYDAGKENETKVARCAVSWLALLNTEIRGAIDRLKQEVKE